jgi:general secretion pathway protein A
MYERFYGLYRPPFAVTPDPSLLYMSRAHREALATIIYGIESRKGFIVCTGEVGTGKTTVIRAFFDQVEAEAFKIIYLFTPQIAPLDMARCICRELDIAEPDAVFSAVPVLQMKLLEIFESGRTVVLMIDEAQLLPAETLEFLRLLSNFETDTEKLIQIVLVGQPEVDEMLARRDMRQVAQRIALRARLGALSLEESVDYMAYRLIACGAGELSQVLSSTAASTIAQAAGGIPRRINILADNVLIAGFGSNQRPVGNQIAAATVREFETNSGGADTARAGRFGWRRRLMRPYDEVPADAPAAPPADRALWEIAALEPANPIEPELEVELEPESEWEGEPEIESNIVRPQFLGNRVEAPLAHGTPRIAWRIRVRPQERFRLRPRGELIGFTERSGTSS